MAHTKVGVHTKQLDCIARRDGDIRLQGGANGFQAAPIGGQYDYATHLAVFDEIPRFGIGKIRMNRNGTRPAGIEGEKMQK